ARARGIAAAPAPRRAHERSRPSGKTRRQGHPRAPARARNLRAPQLTSPLGGRARLRRRRDRRPRPRRRRGRARRAETPGRGGGRHRGGYAAVPRRAPRRRPRHRARAGCERRGGLRRPRRHLDARGRVPGGRRLTAIVLYGLRESLRRKMFVVVLLLTAVFLALYAYGTHAAFKDTRSFVGVNPDRLDTDALAGAIVFGLAMFAILFHGSVLAVFLTLSVVRGDAEGGLLQPLVVR